MATLGQKLAEARTTISITKTGTNAFGKYGYYQIDVIYAEAKEIFEKLGIYTIENVDMFEVAGMPYMKFSLDVVNTEDRTDRETFSAITQMNTMKGAQPAQEAGSTITYMTKYLYGLALMIDDGKSDPDANNTHKEEDIVRHTAKTPASAPAPLMFTDLKARFAGLSQAKKDEYVKKYSIGNPAFPTKANLDMVAKDEKWS